MVDKAVKPVANADAAGGTKAPPQVKLEMSHLKSSYCNVANVTSTREEVVINFGINQNWDLVHKEVDVELLHRIILSPFAAKRLNTMLSKLLHEYEERYGPLS